VTTRDHVVQGEDAARLVRDPDPVADVEVGQARGQRAFRDLVEVDLERAPSRGVDQRVGPADALAVHVQRDLDVLPAVKSGQRGVDLQAVQFLRPVFLAGDRAVEPFGHGFRSS
jgi:hypothetical protein